MSKEALKLEVIFKIMRLNELEDIQLVHRVIDEIQPKEDKLKALMKPTRKVMNVEDLKKEQNFTPIDTDDFFADLDQLEITDSLEDLLEMI